MKFPLPGTAANSLHIPLAVTLLVAAIVGVPAWWVQAAAPKVPGDAAVPKDPGDAAVPGEDGEAGDAASSIESRQDSLPTSLQEARVRSQLLHEMIHGALQVMHRDFFREDESSTLPSRSLEDVFSEMEDRWQVEIHWLTVNAEPMNVDHNPQDAFERQAAKALAAGEKEFEAVEGDRFRYVGSIRLGSQCLKCHVPKRTSLEDRAAGLAITMPIKND